LEKALRSVVLRVPPSLFRTARKRISRDPFIAAGARRGWRETGMATKSSGKQAALTADKKPAEKPEQPQGVDVEG
jgi:hypothetical protein